MTKDLNVIIIDEETKKWQNVVIKDDLDVFYKEIGCNCIDIIVRNIAGKPYNIIIDDEGLLKERNPVLVDMGKQEILVGTVIICNNEGAELTSLTDSDVKNIGCFLNYMREWYGKQIPFIDEKDYVYPYTIGE